MIPLILPTYSWSIVNGPIQQQNEQKHWTNENILGPNFDQKFTQLLHLVALGVNSSSPVNLHDADVKNNWLALDLETWNTGRSPNKTLSGPQITLWSVAPLFRLFRHFWSIFGSSYQNSVMVERSLKWIFWWRRFSVPCLQIYSDAMLLRILNKLWC